MKIRILFLFAVVCSIVNSNSQNNQRLVYNYTFAPSEGVVNKYEKPQRQELCLNGLWDFQGIALPVSYKQGKGIAPELPLPSENDWDRVKIKIPSPWNINSFANRDLAGPDHRNYPSYPESWESLKMAWLKKKVTVPADWTDKVIKLHFEAVAGFAEVYVNNRKVAENFDIFLPFDADITEFAAAGKEIEIRVGVRSQSLFEDNSTIGRRLIPAGSMWGGHISGIWQDVFLIALPKIHITDVYIKPLVTAKVLELDITVKSNSGKKELLVLQGAINEWVNKAGNEVNSAPVPNWKLGKKVLAVPENRIAIEAGTERKFTVSIAVKDEELDFWTPDTPNLYSLVLNLKDEKQTIDTKYERFGWREWTIKGTRQYLNGKVFELKGDSWHFMGVPQLTRRYSWAWFKAIKDANGNAVRPHAQIYPRFYLDMADEMGICVMNETAIWASDGGPKMDSQKFWDACKEHIRRFVLRDRNHASVFGWSVSNENKPVINHVFNRPDLMESQIQAWKDWLRIVRENDSTRPWVSSDGEDDGDGILPVTVGHYGNIESMQRWVNIGKPWGIGEHSMAYYGTPEQVSKYNGERAYESQQGRMEGLANECYDLIANQRKMGASYVSVFNIAWYALKPLPFGKKDITTTPSLNDGIFFNDYVEGVPGIQPERMGPYCSTFNPGYDPNLPLYEPWSMFDAIRAANAPGGPARSEWADVSVDKTATTEQKILKSYSEVFFIGNKDSKLKKILDEQGVVFSSKISFPGQSLYIIDGSDYISEAVKKTLLQNMSKGADVWIWGIVPQTLAKYNEIFPLAVSLEKRAISSFIPEQKSWITGLNNSDFYFCEIQGSDASQYSLSGKMIDEGQVLLNSCNTDWRKWNKRPEEIKTAATVRGEYEGTRGAPVFVKYDNGSSNIYISTLTEFANSEKGFTTLNRMLKNAGIPYENKIVSTADIFFIRDGQIQFPISTKKRLKDVDSALQLELWIFSPRPLDNLLIEPDMPKLNMYITARESKLSVNGKLMDKFNKTNREYDYKELPLQQGWNHLVLSIGKKDMSDFKGVFKCDNKKEFLSLLKVSFENPENK
ncbi:Beta-galactosidase [termite gut metagenome]|uniref:Beta-galactosidase n=1 Tax=termite gut metagenome TaxID=433724 RepID=A0A5J4SVB0_9ZZZZ